ncbi:MAG: hydantoinase/oxoprolinase family protein, partial [Alphaproteobacteria bacterium]
MNAQYRLGIDAGGTFTDFVIADRKSGAITLFKALSTPANPTKAIENGLQLIAEHLGRSASEIVTNCDLCINGTT